MSSGNGTGSIVSVPTGIACGIDCSETYAIGTSISLHAVAGNGSTFVGWSGGGCTGAGDCSISLTADVTVQAQFALSNSVVVTLTGTGVGAVTSAPTGINCPGDCSEAYGPGQMVTLSATAGALSTFTGWSGGGCTGTGTCIVSTNAAVGVTATFTKVMRVLTAIKAGTGAGVVTSVPAGIACGATCMASFDSGALVTLTAAPAVGSTFIGWTGGGCTGMGTCAVTLNAATDVTATFALIPYTLTISKAGTGTGTVTSAPVGISYGATCATTFNFGQSVMLTATPGPGSTFMGWTGGGCTGTGACVVGISAATQVTATFTLQAFALSVLKSGNGSGTVTSAPVGINCGATCAASYNYGSTVTLGATPAPGSTFAGWTGGGCAGTGSCTVTIAAATQVTATFALQQFVLTIVRAGNGSGTVGSNVAGISCGATCTASYNYDTTVTLSAAPAVGSAFSGWSGAGCTGTGSCTTTVTAAVSVTATFTKLFSCTTVSNAVSCTNAVISEINLGGIGAAACHDQCTDQLANAGVASGCWVVASNGNCYCRGGVLNLGSTFAGGSCN